jgi:predicted enzyme related to lactoylglutathione lyase
MENMACCLVIWKMVLVVELRKDEGFEPSTKGALIYLNGGEDLSVPLSKVEAAGGKILLPKTSIGSNGFMAHIIDTEGNKIALHSMK